MNMKGKTRTQKGITLIALIITIVVLLILATVAISSITNDGILSYATNAAKDYNQAVKNEQDMLQEYANYLNNNNGSANYEAYSIGDEVTIGTESFYVIKDSGKTESKVLLLAKENINPTTLVQDGNDNYVAFSTESYWGEGTSPYDIVEPATILESHIAAKAAYDYGTKVGGAGRLMTYAEAYILDQNTTFNSKLYKTSFWLGTAFSADSVWYASNGSYILRTTYSDAYDICGVRPVVEISKSKLS